MTDSQLISPAHPLLNAAIRLDKLPANGRALEISAGEEECVAIARRMQVDAVSQFSARVNARPLKGGVEISGNLTAKIVQTCVVTFVPVEDDVSQSFERVFLPDTHGESAPKPGSELFVDLEGDDLPDYFEGPEVDLTELLMEVLALNINPYPRAPDAELPDVAINEDDREQSPFAALEQLKKPRD